MAFDPYHKWLGISKERRPITYYALLGVEAREGDTDVLRSALDQRRAFIRSKLGQGHDHDANKILQQLDVAASTLLVPENKHKYDRQLASQPKKPGKGASKKRRSSVILPNVVEQQVVRVYGEGSGIFGDVFGIMAVIVAGIAIMALLAAQLNPGKLSTSTGNQSASVEASAGAASLDQPTEKSHAPSTDGDSNGSEPLTEPSGQEQATPEVNQESPKPETSAPPVATEFVGLPEIDGNYLSLTGDGLTAFWEGSGSSGSAIFTSRREDSESYFEEQQELFPGRHPAISADGLELIFLSESAGTQHQTLHATVRESIDAPFPRAEEISELREVRLPKSPFLSSYGLVLCFTRFKGRGETETVFSTRRSKEDRWSAPRTLAINPPSLKGAITWPSLSPDGTTLFATHEQTKRGDGILGELMVWKRDSRDEPFREYSFVEVENCPPLQVRAPRYVASTQELFISAHPRSSKISGNGIIKNFQIP